VLEPWHQNVAEFRRDCLKEPEIEVFRQSKSWRCVLGIILLSGFIAPAGMQSSDKQELLHAPIGSFVFDASLGNPSPPIAVWYYRPERIEPLTRVVFLMHGSSRTGREARDLGAVYGKKHAFILLAPEFSEKDYPGDAYAFGNMLGPDAKLLSQSVWSFTTIERLFDLVRKRLELTIDTYDILGHSAGGQFIHRMVLFAPDVRFRRAVASSPGRYALPKMSERFPYGFRGTSLDSSILARAFSRDFVLVLGDRDTDDRVREPEAMSQGGNRFARGLRFFATATEQANVLKVPLAWRLRIVYGVDHSPRAAVQAGFEELLR
jgi:pimeloyl-ACP methyl ester carboxylesterase